MSEKLKLIFAESINGRKVKYWSLMAAVYWRIYRHEGGFAEGGACRTLEEAKRLVRASIRATKKEKPKTAKPKNEPWWS